MHKFSKRSLKHLGTCDQRIQRLVWDISAQYNVTVICGHRNEQTQNEAYKKGYSQLQYPHSKHNQTPSTAIDMLIWPTLWNTPIVLWPEWVQHVKEKWHKLNPDTNIIWGGSWKTIIDKAHWEIAE